MFVNFSYSGDCNIQVGVKKFKAGIKDLQVMFLRRMYFYCLKGLYTVPNNFEIIFLSSNDKKLNFKINLSFF